MSLSDRFLLAGMLYLWSRFCSIKLKQQTQVEWNEERNQYFTINECEFHERKSLCHPTLDLPPNQTQKMFSQHKSIQRSKLILSSYHYGYAATVYDVIPLAMKSIAVSWLRNQLR